MLTYRLRGAHVHARLPLRSADGNPNYMSTTNHENEGR